MEKKTYYVTVGSAEILEPKDVIGNYELEIEATEEDIDQLQEMFEDAQEWDETSAGAMLGFSSYVLSKYDDDLERANSQSLKAIYRKLYELGTPETKKQIESMKVLD
ncbi:hypothetical protein [Paenibacillus ginsengihumi]|uniref:hypothetical protein n=1 Tax=Paenibacillus ginsengihumi TaxID=431596 RepID=UPI00035EDB1E|nr:hypothetical protein [Paenibacillus ginsengihumi]